jgi:hypothetical protein
MNSVYPKLPQKYLECGECDMDWKCIICLETKKESNCIRMITSCGHVFHKKCLSAMLHAQPEHIKTVVKYDDFKKLIQQDTLYDKDNFSTSCEVACPECKTAIYLDNGVGIEEFAIWEKCNCCVLHKKNRPPSYNFWEIPFARHEQIQERIYRITYSDGSVCSCFCRRRMRDLVRILPIYLK